MSGSRGVSIAMGIADESMFFMLGFPLLVWSKLAHIVSDQCSVAPGAVVSAFG